MTDRILIPLPDGRWLGLTTEQFAAAELAGRETVPSPVFNYQAQVPDELLTAEQLQARTSVPASWWEQAARGHRVPHARIGRYVRFRFAEVAEHFSISLDPDAWRESRPARRSKKK